MNADILGVLYDVNLFCLSLVPSVRLAFLNFFLSSSHPHPHSPLHCHPQPLPLTLARWNYRLNHWEDLFAYWTAVDWLRTDLLAANQSTDTDYGEGGRGMRNKGAQTAERPVRVPWFHWASRQCYRDRFSATILATISGECISDAARIGSIIFFHLSKLWKANFFILCDVTFLVRLQGKFEADHSWEWKG